MRQTYFYRLIIFWLLMCSLGCFSVMGQQPHCGTDLVHWKYIKSNPSYLQQQHQLEKRLYPAIKSRWENRSSSNKNAALSPITIPVVFHVIYKDETMVIGQERIGECLRYLNEGFGNENEYFSEDGEDSYIRFCLAKVDPKGQPTNGITYHHSDYGINFNFDQTFKELYNWNPLVYLNVYVVDRICETDTTCGVAGYAFFPQAYGYNYDGVVIMRDYTGVSRVGDVVINHEVGHYMNLRHTFHGGCQNNNCLLDGDQVCDTPPDSTSSTFFGCNEPINSCTTDADDPFVENPFQEDIDDRQDLFMDYNKFECMRSFTEGQNLRMRVVADSIRYPMWQNQRYLCDERTTNCPPPENVMAEVVSDSILIAYWNPVTTASRYEIRHWNISTGKQGNQWTEELSWSQTGAFINQIHLLMVRSWCGQDTSHFVNLRPNFSFPTFCEGEQTLSANKGTFTDGSGGTNYGPNSNCSWLIQPDGAALIRITVDQFATEKDYDWLTIYDGPTTADNVLVRLSGDERPQEAILTSQATALVTFTSNEGFERAGWQISYQTEGLTATPKYKNAFQASIYPHPTNGSFTIHLQQASTLKVEMINVQGQSVHHFELAQPKTRFSITLNDLAKGYYTLALQFPNGESQFLPLLITD